MFELRPATAEDRELLWRIQWLALGPYVAADFGSDRAEQRRFFEEHFRIEAHQIVRVAGEDAGYLLYEPREDHVYLANMALLPGFQRRGVGSALVRFVIAEAEAQGLPVRLQVLRSNPARNFYERLGFERVGETDTHWLMARARREPRAGGGMLEGG